MKTLCQKNNLVSCFRDVICSSCLLFSISSVQIQTYSQTTSAAFLLDTSSFCSHLISYSRYKKAYGFACIHTLGGLYSVFAEFTTCRKGKYTIFAFAKSQIFSDRRNDETPDFIGGFLDNIFFIALRWQRMKDSNPHKRSQSPVCYHYTNPLSARDIIQHFRFLSIPNFLFSKKDEAGTDLILGLCITAFLHRYS